MFWRRLWLRINETEFFYQVDVLDRILSRDCDSEFRPIIDDAKRYWTLDKKRLKYVVRRVRRLWIELCMNPPLNETMTEMLARKARDHKKYGVE